MNNLIAFIHKMNLLVWIVGIFVAHALLYLLLETRSWLATSLLATAFYAVVLFALKSWASRQIKNREGNR
ncbi:hypothetical protein [Brevibacillus fulvus]|uniref:Uncharacterized protein n=1 Tax=Brevibacillus fulvus TaxID=1125967 RepID=A0A938XXZ9_9BACL|nr:hypothetical protein [Brevibacillus fulvus]MBM7589760.1 hypothetical protein [Brevibacillus fulvus]